MIITTYNTVFVKINGNNLDSLKKCLAIRYFLIKIHLKTIFRPSWKLYAYWWEGYIRVAK